MPEEYFRSSGNKQSWSFERPLGTGIILFRRESGKMLYPSPTPTQPPLPTINVKIKTVFTGKTLAKSYF
jgi:hypothetical protein